MSNNTGVRSLGPQKVLHATIASADASIEAIAAPGDGKRINVLGLSISASAAGTVTLLSAATEKGRNTFKAADPAWVLPSTPDCWVICGENEAFNLGNASTLTLAGVVTYMVVG